MTTESQKLEQEIASGLSNESSETTEPIIINEQLSDSSTGQGEEEEVEEVPDELTEERNKIKLLLIKNPELVDKLKLTPLKVDKLSAEQIQKLLPFIQYALYNNSNTVLINQLINILNRIVSNVFKVDYEELNANQELRATIVNLPITNRIFDVIPSMLFAPLRYGLAILSLKFKNRNNNIPPANNDQQQIKQQNQNTNAQ